MILSTGREALPVLMRTGREDLPDPGTHPAGALSKEVPTMHPYLKSRREAYEEIRSAITTVQDTAVREERDLTEPELTQIRSLSEQAKAIADEIEALAEHESRAEAVRSVAAAVHGGSTAADDPFAPFSLLP